jgi:hypothetical protein
MLTQKMDQTVLIMQLKICYNYNNGMSWCYSNQLQVSNMEGIKDEDQDLDKAQAGSVG